MIVKRRRGRWGAGLPRGCAARRGVPGRPRAAEGGVLRGAPPELPAQGLWSPPSPLHPPPGGGGSSPPRPIPRLPRQPLDARPKPARLQPAAGAKSRRGAQLLGRPLAVAALRTAKLRSSVKEFCIPQICEALLCGLLATCPEDPLSYLELMIKYISESGLSCLLWDMCIDQAVKPKIRKLSETYLEQLFGLNNQLDKSMRYISEGCPGVLYLHLSNTSITNRTMQLLPRNFHSLQNLSLAYCRKFTDKGLQYLNLGSGCHKLTYLDLSGCTQISIQGFRHITNSCSGIMHLTISDMPTLMDNCVKITDSVMEQLTIKCHYLHILDISGCILTTDYFLENLGRGCNQLCTLMMLYCRQISMEAALRMSKLVQYQEHSPEDRAPWFGYDVEGKPLKEGNKRTTLTNERALMIRDLRFSGEEAV